MYTSKILSKNNLNKDIITFKLEKPVDFKFKAGQFVQIMIPDKDNSTKGVFRAYSLCSTPKDNFLGFCLRVVPDGKASSFLEKAKVGDEIKFKGPNGRFICEAKDKSLHMIAAGIGIAPIMSILRNEFENKKNQENIYLMFGLRSPEDIFWAEEFNGFKNKYKNFHYEVWAVPPEEFTKNLIEHLKTKAKKEDHFFICGSAQMMKEIKDLLLEHNIPSENIHFEVL